MGQFLAILRDTIRESIAKRSLMALLLIGAVLVVASFSITFEARPEAEVLELHVSRMGYLVDTRSRMQQVSRGTNLHVNLDVIRRVEAEDGFDPEFLGAMLADLRVDTPHTVDAFHHSYQSHLEYLETGKYPDPPDASAYELFPDQRRAEVLETRLRDFGYVATASQVLPADSSRPVGERALKVRMALRRGPEDEVPGSHTLRLAFGALPAIPLSDTSVAETLVQIQIGFVNSFMGFFGILILLSTCASFVPDLLHNGTLDLVLARPIGRARLILYKYLAGVVFVGLVCTFFMLGSATGLAAGSGFWNPWFAGCALTMTAVFAVLYSVAVLFGVLTRNSNLATLMSLAVWAASSLMVTLKHTVGSMTEDGSKVRLALDTAYNILPKTSEMDHLNTLLMARSKMSPAFYESTIAPRIPDIDWTFSLGTTAAFLVAMLVLACWRFGRQDW